MSNTLLMPKHDLFMAYIVTELIKEIRGKVKPSFYLGKTQVLLNFEHTLEEQKLFLESKLYTKFQGPNLFFNSFTKPIQFFIEPNEKRRNFRSRRCFFIAEGFPKKWSIWITDIQIIVIRCVCMTSTLELVGIYNTEQLIPCQEI